MRCARRRKGAAYQHYRRRSVSGRHAVIMPSASHASPTLSGHVPHASDCKAAAESSSDRASFPGKRERKPSGKRQATRCDAHAATRRVPRVTQTSSHATLSLDLSSPNLDSRFLVGQPEPVVRTFVLQAVHSKNETAQTLPSAMEEVRDWADHRTQLRDSADHRTRLLVVLALLFGVGTRPRRRRISSEA